MGLPLDFQFCQLSLLVTGPVQTALDGSPRIYTYIYINPNIYGCRYISPTVSLQHPPCARGMLVVATVLKACRATWRRMHKHEHATTQRTLSFRCKTDRPANGPCGLANRPCVPMPRKIQVTGDSHQPSQHPSKSGTSLRLHWPRTLGRSEEDMI